MAGVDPRAGLGVGLGMGLGMGLGVGRSVGLDVGLDVGGLVVAVVGPENIVRETATFTVTRSRGVATRKSTGGTGGKEHTTLQR